MTQISIWLPIKTHQQKLLQSEKKFLEEGLLKAKVLLLAQSKIEMAKSMLTMNAEKDRASVHQGIRLQKKSENNGFRIFFRSTL